MSRERGPDAIVADLDRLLDAWSERRCYRALRWILPSWPGTLAHSDQWGELRRSLQEVLAFARGELTPGEEQEVSDLVAAVDVVIRQRLQG